MGGGQSRTRRITMDNDEATSVVKISDDVVHRLKGFENKKPVVSGSVNPGIVDPSLIGVVQPYYYQPLTSLQILQDKEAAIKKNDRYWEKRVSDLEKVHGQMHQVMETEFHKAMEEVQGGPKAKSRLELRSPPCQMRKKAVVDCYKEHSREPMKCSKEVEAFAECVDVQRATLIANRS